MLSHYFYFFLIRSLRLIQFCTLYILLETQILLFVRLYCCSCLPSFKLASRAVPNHREGIKGIMRIVPYVHTYECVEATSCVAAQQRLQQSSQISENTIVGHTRANESNSTCIQSDELRHAPWICRLGPKIQLLVNYIVLYKALAQNT